jgi:hypothetical protein
LIIGVRSLCVLDGYKNGNGTNSAADDATATSKNARWMPTRKIKKEWKPNWMPASRR